MSLKGNFRCQFVYTLYGVLAKIIFRSCVTREAAICIKNGTFEYFDGTNPITGKDVSYSSGADICRIGVELCAFGLKASYLVKMLPFLHGLISDMEPSRILVLTRVMAISFRRQPS